MKKVEKCRDNKVSEKKCFILLKRKNDSIIMERIKWKNNSTTIERRKYYSHMIIFSRVKKKFSSELAF